MFIGTNAVHWDADTILVTYSSCNSSGIDNINNNNSIAAATCNRGANVVVGFRTEINPYSATSWNVRYNSKLGEGWGVLDSANYANSFTYFNSNVKNGTVWNHGDANIKIGKYRNSNIHDDRKDILNNKSKEAIREDDFTMIYNQIKEQYKNFQEINYEVIQSEGLMGVNVKSGKEENLFKYTDLQMKIGDFYTDAGYTIVSKNGIVEAIYDNNVNVEKQEKMLNSRSILNSSLEDNDIDKYKERAVIEVREKYNDQNIKVKKQSHKFYYDIINEKKYIVITILNEMSDENSAISEDSIFYEI